MWRLSKHIKVTLILLAGIFVHGSAAQECTGNQTYKLVIRPKWDESTDKTFHNGSAIGYVIVVSHDRSYTLFSEGKKLEPTVKHLLQRNRAGPLLQQIYRLEKQKTPNSPVHSVTFASSALPNSGEIQFNVKVADASSYISFIGVLQGTPDSFFGISRFNLCRDGKFIQKFPLEKTSTAWTIAYDGGYDAREHMVGSTVALAENKPVRKETRKSLDLKQTYATYTLEQGEFRNWKCLHVSMRVRLSSGTTVRVDELRVGDMVQSTTDGHFSEIYMFTHASKERSDFVNLTTSRGTWVVVTPGHLVRINDGKLARAGDIRVGDALLGDHHVVQVTNFVDDGIYNPHTFHGDVVVNGIQTSSYTTAVEANIAHSGLSIFRALWYHARWYSNFLRCGLPTSQSLVGPVNCAA